MAKTLLERVDEANTGKTRNSLRYFLLAHRAEIQETLEHGHGIKVIWQTLRSEGSVHCTYSYFYKAVRKYLEWKPKTGPTTRPPSTTFQKTPQTSVATKKYDGFIYNPKPNPDELY